MTEPVLVLEDLQVQFSTNDGTVSAVDGLSLQVAPGEMLGIVGESGCGKSTSALAINGLLPSAGKVTGGRILLNGRDLVPLPRRELDKLRGPEVAMVFQDALAALNPTMKIGKQLMEPLAVHMGLRGKAAQNRATELLEQVGIPSARSRLNSYPHEFSGGMRQRVMIAIALACSPKLLVADEPTTALDVTIQRQILDLLLRLREDTGAGIVLITHDVGVVAETCDNVVVMYAGRAVETGPTEEVFRRPNHPYTKGLLNSSLDLTHDRTKPLEAIPGLPPDLVDLPPGCPFAPRCTYRTEKCDVEPEMTETVTPGHDAACWHIDAAKGEVA